MLYDQMKQKRKVKSLLPKKFCLDGRMLSILLLVLSLVLCLGSVSLLTHSVKAAGTSPMNIESIPYTWIDNKVEVLYNMQFVDPLDSEKVVNNLYMSGESLYISPNIIVVSGDNIVWTWKYAHILWWTGNKIDSNNITIIAWKNNEVLSGNDNASILWWIDNKFAQWNDAWIPMIAIWWESNEIRSWHNWVALIWWSYNVISWDVSSSFILWWKNNIIEGAKDVIIWWRKAHIVYQDDLFVYSNSDEYFSPLGDKAFYLDVISGAGINTEWIEWLSVGGAVSIGGKRNHSCTAWFAWEVLSYSGCLIWCTDVWISKGKWEMLDMGSRCIEFCKEHHWWCFISSDVIEVNDYTAQCTKWVNTGNAHLCVSASDWLQLHKNVLFETTLIDSEQKCNDTQDVCVYQCNPWTHLTWDGANRRCYSDCSYTRNDGTEVRDIKHGAFITWYDVDEIKCESNGAGDVCSNHVKSLYCNDGEMKLGSMDGVDIELREFFKECSMSWYVCSPSYNLTYSDIVNNLHDSFSTGGLKWWDTVTWTRWVYEVCINFWWVGMDTCNTWAQNFKFKNCKPWYVLDSNWVCRKGCEWLNNGDKKTFYKSGTVTCTGTCVGSEFTCYDGEWTWSENKSQYPYTWCNLKDKVCDTSVYNVTYQEYLTWLSKSIYECCTGYIASGNTQCNLWDTVCKLVWCKQWYHTGANGKFCVDDTMYCQPPVPSWNWIRRWSDTFERWILPDDTPWKHVEDTIWGNPWVCEWMCDIANGWVWDGNLWCTCKEGYQLSEDGKSCEPVPSATTYHCIWDEPGQNTVKWEGNPTDWDKEWTYIADFWADLWPCEWRCKEMNYTRHENERYCDPAQNAECWLVHFMCDGWTSSNQATWDKEWTWNCGDSFCKECRSDLWYYEDAVDGICKMSGNGFDVCRKISYVSVNDCWRAEPWSVPKPDQIMYSMSFKKVSGTNGSFNVRQPIIHRFVYQFSSVPFVYDQSECDVTCDMNWEDCGLWENCSLSDIYWWWWWGKIPLAVCSRVNSLGNFWIQYAARLWGNPIFDNPDARFVGECPPECWNNENECAYWTKSWYDPEAHTWYCSNTNGDKVKCQMRYTTCPDWYSVNSNWECEFNKIEFCATLITPQEFAESSCNYIWWSNWYNPQNRGSNSCCGDPSVNEPGTPGVWPTKIVWDGVSACSFWSKKIFTFEGYNWANGLYFLEPHNNQSCWVDYTEEILSICSEDIERYSGDSYDNWYIINHCDELRNSQYQVVEWCNKEVVKIW